MWENKDEESKEKSQYDISGRFRDKPLRVDHGLI